jgi:hypothetical protein
VISNSVRLMDVGRSTNQYERLVDDAREWLVLRRLLETIAVSGTPVEDSRPVVKLVVASFGVSRQVAACDQLSFRGKLHVWTESVLCRPPRTELGGRVLSMCSTTLNFAVEPNADCRYQIHVEIQYPWMKGCAVFKASFSTDSSSDFASGCRKVALQKS